MWPSTSCCTRAGSHVGIWLPIAVTIPNANEAKPRTRKMRSRRRSRSLRILWRRPLSGASSLRLRRNKRPILAPVGGDPGGLAVVERGGFRHLVPAAFLLVDQAGGAPGTWDARRDRGPA